MASSVLMLTNPRSYGVIDIRVWELLYAVDGMRTNPRGVAFTFEEWHRYLKILRYFARMYSVKARDIERTLFEVHQHYQEGTLY